MHSTIAIDVAAPPGLVFTLARDVERWERLLPHYARSRALERRADGSLIVDFVARRPLDRPARVRAPGRLAVAHLERAGDAAPSLRARGRGDQGDGRHVADRAVGAGSRVSIDHDFRPRVALFAAFVDRAFTRPIAGRTLATFKALAEALAEESEPAAAQRILSHERPTAHLDHGDRRHHADRDRARRVPGRAARRLLPGQAHRPLRPEPVPLAGRGPGRRLRPARLDAAQDRAPARPVQPVRAGRRPPRARRRRADARASMAGRIRSGSGSISARRSAASPTPRSSTSATSRRGSARSHPTSRWRSSAARRRPTSGSRSTCAARSCRPPTRARRARSRSARRSGTCARAGSMPRSPVAARSR